MQIKKDYYRRWKYNKEREGLTWGRFMDGGQVWAAFESLRCRIRSTDIVLEVGPGYGRVFKTFSQHVDFKRWYFVDINEGRTQELAREFSAWGDKIRVLNQNVEMLNLPEPFDVGISTVTLHHLYPDLGKGLERIIGAMSDRGYFVFDMNIAAKDRICDSLDGISIVNYYSRKNLEKIIKLCGGFIAAEGHVDYGDHKKGFYRIEKSKKKRPLAYVRRQIQSTIRLLRYRDQKAGKETNSEKNERN